MNPLNLDQVRAEVPALAGDTVYLDNAGGSLVLRRVADRVCDYLLTSSVQLGASYAQSQAAGERVLAARRAVAELINAPHDDEVVMGGATKICLPWVAIMDMVHFSLGVMLGFFLVVSLFFRAVPVQARNRRFKPSRPSSPS